MVLASNHAKSRSYKVDLHHVRLERARRASRRSGPRAPFPTSLPISAIPLCGGLTFRMSETFKSSGLGSRSRWRRRRLSCVHPLMLDPSRRLPSATIIVTERPPWSSCCRGRTRAQCHPRSSPSLAFVPKARCAATTRTSTVDVPRHPPAAAEPASAIAPQQHPHPQQDEAMHAPARPGPSALRSPSSARASSRSTTTTSKRRACRTGLRPIHAPSAKTYRIVRSRSQSRRSAMVLPFSCRRSRACAPPS